MADRLAGLASVTRDELMLLTCADLRVAAGEEQVAEKEAQNDDNAETEPVNETAEKQPDPQQTSD